MTAREARLDGALRKAMRIIARLEREQLSREGQEFLSEARRAILIGRPASPEAAAPDSDERAA